MKLIVASAITAALVVSPASAADMPVKAHAAAVVQAWSGCYIGINGGGAWGNWNYDTGRGPTQGGGFFFATPASFNLGLVDTFANDRSSGYVAGGQAGCNWRSSQWVVVGFEVDGQASGLQGSRNLSTVLTLNPGIQAAGPITLNYSDRMPWFATARARVGILATEQTLLYGTVGAAVAELKTSASFATSFTFASSNGGSGLTCNAGTAACFAGSTSGTRLGLAAGGGIEHKFTDRLSLKAEYLALVFKSETALEVPGPGATLITGTNTVPYSTGNLWVHVARIGLNYSFGGPVVAAY